MILTDVVQIALALYTCIRAPQPPFDRNAWPSFRRRKCQKRARNSLHPSRPPLPPSTFATYKLIFANQCFYMFLPRPHIPSYFPQARGCFSGSNGSFDLGSNESNSRATAAHHRENLPARAPRGVLLTLLTPAPWGTRRKTPGKPI